MKPDRTPTARTGRLGFTIVELFIAFIIIGILVLIMTPVLTKRSEEARITAARADLQALKDAMERAAIDTGYLIRPYALNDGLQGDGTANSNPESWAQGIRDNAIDDDTNIYEDPEHLFILLSGGQTDRGDFAPNGRAIFDRLLINETQFGWNGPYINWTRDPRGLDWPHDPWGNPYHFFTRHGLLIPPEPDSDDTQMREDVGARFRTQADAPQYTLNGEQIRFPTGLIFDRPTWLSLGPNGVPGSGTTDPGDPDFGYGGGDDLIVQFGGF